ncbi:MAG TPA: hypothetical protein VK898_02300 [Chloroflexota bacterium]|nr:hypothetical protein [Chloroflexota bacterium]
MSDIALPGTGSRPLAALADASPRRLLRDHHVLMAVIAGVTWLALVGGVLSTDILSAGAAGAGSHHSGLPSYAAYNSNELVPTSFGSLQVTRADLTPQADLTEVHVSMHVVNNQDAQIDAPRFEDLRLINTNETEAKPQPGGWNGPAVLIGHSSATVELTYLAPRDMGLLWLEYRDPRITWPLRVVLGSAPAPQPAAAVAPGDVQ